MRKVIQHESKTYLALMPVVEKPTTPRVRYDTSTGQDLLNQFSIDMMEYYRWWVSWIECTGFEIGQEVEEGEWEMVNGVFSVYTGYAGNADSPDFNESLIDWAYHQVKQVAIPKQQPEREEEIDWKKAAENYKIALRVIETICEAKWSTLREASKAAFEIKHFLTTRTKE